MYQKALPKLSNPPPHAAIEPVAVIVFVTGEGGDVTEGLSLTDQTFDPSRTCSTQEDAADIDDEAKTGLACGDIEREGDLQGSAQGCNDIVCP